jgi:hypothetical protein
VASSEERRIRDLKILRMTRGEASARKIAAALGMSERHIQRIIAEKKAEHQERLERLSVVEEPTMSGRARGLEALGILKRSMEMMADVVEANEPEMRTGIVAMVSRRQFEVNCEEIEALLLTVPQVVDLRRHRPRL